MTIIKYLDFKNLILENTNVDDPFASIEKSIKGTSSRIKNSLTKDNNLIELKKYYFILDKDNIAKRILINKFERGQITYLVINDSNVGKYDPGKVKSGENKPITLPVRDMDIYKDLNIFIKNHPEFKEKSVLLKQTQFIPKNTDGGPDGGGKSSSTTDKPEVKNTEQKQEKELAPVVDIRSGKEIKKTGTY